MSNKPQNVEEIVVPDEFYKIINDFITDILRKYGFFGRKEEYKLGNNIW